MAISKLRPFFDTSALLAGLRFPTDPAAEMLRQQVRQEIGIVFSRQVLEELVAVVRAVAPSLLGMLESFLVAAQPEICVDPDPGDVRRLVPCVGEDDAPILAAAMLSRADCLVTLDPRHLAPEVARCARFPVLAPSARLTALGAPSSGATSRTTAPG